MDLIHRSNVYNLRKFVLIKWESYAFNLFDKISHLHLNVWIYYVENLFCINFQIDFEG